MKTKIYVFDIDGTISEKGQKVSEAICRKIKQLSYDRKIIFASARPVRDMLPMIESSLHQGALFIGCNGGMAYQDGEFLFANSIAIADVQLILNFLQQHQIPYVLDGIWDYSFSKVSHPFQQYIRTLSDCEVDEVELLAQGVTKVLVLSEYMKADLLSVINAHLAVHFHKSEAFYDITVQGNNKFNTIRKLIGDEPYVAFGNDQNDFLMLDHAAISVFVGTPDTYSRADYYVDTVNIESILDRLEK